MRRFYLSEIAGDDVVITGTEAEHIARVLRMKEGQELLLFDGSGYDYHAKIAAIDKNAVHVTVGEKERAKTEPRVQVTVYQAVIKQDKFDYAVQKCTELGAYKIVPFTSERCVKRPKSPQNFVEKAQRVAMEAAKQCRRSKIPVIGEIVEIDHLMSGAPELVLLAYEDEKVKSIRQALEGKTHNKIGIVIGPEGGFTEVEAAQLVKEGVQSISLGKRILRAETASVAALTAVLYTCGEMEI